VSTDALPLVLLADDHEDFRTSIAFHLALAGYPVIEASTVADAVARSDAIHPDLVVVSDELGHQDVADILGALAEAPMLADVPVITLSSDGGSDRLAQCLSHGARDHVRRDEGALALLARIDAVLRTDDELERLRRRNAELEFLGAVDPTTGLANRRMLEEELDRMAAGAARHGLALSAVMARIDPLPPHGGPLARARRTEAVLREAAYLVASVRRTDDYAGVWDSRTFLLLLPVTPLDGARIFAERLRRVVDVAPLRCGDELVSATLTCACAEIGTDPAASVEQLEAAIRDAEPAGGDRVL
jgi:diguanylate cyclase (GGDEF)-like protein